MTNQRLIDFHCHLDLYKNHQDIIDECEKNALYTLAVTTTPKAWPRNQEMLKGKKYVRAALGLHPQLIKEDSSEDLKLWQSYLPESKYVGEVGIDASKKFSHTLNEQTRIFKIILECSALAGGKILTVHSVRSAKKVLDLIQVHFPCDRGRVVLHWFTGTTKEAEQALKLGCYFSINTEMLKTSKGRDLLSWLPLDRILTETDGPFTSNENGISHPKDVIRTIESLSLLRQVSSNKIASIIASNLVKLLRDRDS